jgi:hypothetical protein
MENERLSKPSPADYYRLRALDQQEEGSWSTEYEELWNAFDWTPDLILEGGKCGLKSLLGEMILPVNFEDVKLLSASIVERGDRIVAQQNGKWGVVLADGEGTWLMKPEFDYIGYPNNITHVQKDGTWGVNDIAKNEFLIQPECEYVNDDNGFMFINGISIYVKDGKTGVITSYGAHTEPIFEEVELDPEGLVQVKYDGKWGFITEDNMFTEDEDEAGYWYEDL